MATYNITLKAWSDNATLEPLTIYQNDVLSRTINITLMDSNGPPIDLTDSAVRVYFVKDDKKIVYQEADIISETNGKISVTLTSQCAAVPGPVVAMVQAIYNNGSTLNIGPLRLIVAANNLDNAIISTNDFSALTEALSTVQQYDGRIATNTADIADLETGKADKPIDTGWIEPTLINGFTQPANTVETRVAYRRIGNIVYVRGTAYGGSVNNAIFAVPVNLQPSRAVRFLTTNQSQTYNRIGVAGGNLSVTGPSYGQWVSLDSVYWILD